MQDLRVHVTNFLGHGVTRRKNELDGDISLFSLDIEGYAVCIEQVYLPTHKNLKQLKGGKIPTTEIVVKNVKTTDVSKALKISDRLCWLMTFIGLTMSCRYKYEYPDGNPIEERNVIGSLHSFRTTLELRNGPAIQTLLQNGYAPFKKYEKSRDLRAVFGYLANAHSHPMPLQFKLLGCFVILESLKSTYAEVSQIPFIRGAYRKGINPTKNSPSYSFEELLNMMLGEYGLKIGLRRIIKLRNDIVHTGYTKRSFDSQVKQFDRINDILRIYLLKLIEYEGSYPIYSKANRSYGEV